VEGASIRVEDGRKVRAIVGRIEDESGDREGPVLGERGMREREDRDDSKGSPKAFRHIISPLTTRKCDE
jgi:hypothetical protein